MAGQRTTFAKIQRERAKQAKQEAKRAAKLGTTPYPSNQAPERPTDEERSGKREDFLLRGTSRLNPQQLLEAVELLTAQQASGALDDDEVEAIRQDVIARAS